MQQIVLVRQRMQIIRRAKPMDGRRVRVTWADSSAETKDISPLFANHRSLVRLRTDDALFAALSVSPDGDRLVWPGGLSVTAISLANLPQLQMDSHELVAIMAELGLGSEGRAAYVGLSRRAITDYRAGAPIPSAVVLALRYCMIWRRARPIVSRSQPHVKPS